MRGVRKSVEYFQRAILTESVLPLFKHSQLQFRAQTTTHNVNTEERNVRRSDWVLVGGGDDLEALAL